MAFDEDDKTSTADSWDDEEEVEDDDEEEDDEEEEPNSGISCPHCQGEGCESCNDTGYLIVYEGDTVCPNCHGAGGTGWFVDESQCGVCTGEGTVDAERLRDYQSGTWKPLYSSMTAAQYSSGSDCYAGTIHPLYRAFVEEDLGEAIFEDQDVRGQDFTRASVFAATTPEEIGHVAYELIDGLLTITDDPKHSFAGANFTGATMQNVNLGGSDFTRATLDQADLRQANLTACIFTGGNLAGADLRNASLRGAMLRGAKLAGANLEGADLTGAYLAGADLTGATIEDAASVVDARLAGVAGLSPEQRAWCQDHGARFDDPEQIPDWDALPATP